MAQTYTAFISYRHCPLDSAVAETLHKRIERYRIPRDLRKSGKKHLGVVFRDRDELPLSNNLTEDIYEALDNAEYLIVICTPETPKSMWVDREIQHFLEKHSHDRILTVLAAGTPEESIPKRITTIYGPDGAVVEQVEPLCAFLVDENEKKVLRNLHSEFLRLAAAILECPYDALKQRQKRYRTRRLIAACCAVGAVLLTIICLLVRWNLDVTQKNEEISAMNQQIQEQLHQTQLKESQALTLLSRDRLENGDRMGALETAMEALPDEETDRPFYAPAKTALEKALGLYHIGYHPDIRLEIPSGVGNLALSGDGRFAAGATQDGHLRCYDLYTGKPVWEVPKLDEYFVESFHFLPNQESVLCTTMGGNQYILDGKTGTLRFSYAFEKRSFPLDYAPDESQMAISDQDCVTFCSLLTEQTVRSVSVEENATPHPCEGAYNADGSRFLMLCAADFGAGEQLRMRLFDTVSGELLVDELLMSPQAEVWQENVTPLDDGGFFLSVSYEGQKVCVRISREGMLLDAGVFAFADDYRTDGTVLGVQQGEARQIGDSVYLISSGRFCQVDLNSCELVREHRLLSGHELCWVYEDGSYLVRNQDEEFQLYVPDDRGGFSLSRRWTCDFPLEYLAFIENDPDVFVSFGDAIQVIRWTGDPEDPLSAVQVLPHSLSGNLIYLPRFCGVYPSQSGENLLILDTDATVLGDERQYVYHIPTDTVTVIPSLPGHGAVFSGDEGKILSYQGLYDLQSAAGTALGEGVMTVCRNDRISGMPALSAAYRDGVLHWWQDGETHEESKNPWHTQAAEIRCVGQNGSVLLYGDGEMPYVLCDTKTGEWQQVNLPVQGPVLEALGRTSPLAAFACADGTLYLHDLAQGKQLFQLENVAYSCFAMVFLQDDTVLLLANQDGYTLVDLGTEKIRNHIFADFSYQGLGATYLMVQESADGSHLYISNALAETPGLVVETATWTLEWEIEGMLGYLPYYDAILCTDSEYTQLLLHPNLSTENLIEMGEKLLAGERD